MVLHKPANVGRRTLLCGSDTVAVIIQQHHVTGLPRRSTSDSSLNANIGLRLVERH